MKSVVARPHLRAALPAWIALGLALAAAAPAWSASAARDERREWRQEARIAQGVASGELTRGETQRLLRQQARIDQAQDAARADGRVGPREAAALERLQDRSSRAIARQRQDRQQRRGR